MLVFGLFHGFGLATKLQEFALSPNGLVANIVSFNVGVEIGQVIALTGVLIALSYWRTRRGFLRHAFVTNGVLMAARVPARRLSAVGILPGSVMATNELDAGGPVVARERLALAAGAALLVAGVILVIAVLPAEFGVDPTGIGRRLGLTAMSDIQKSLEAFEANRGAAAAGGRDRRPPGAGIPARDDRLEARTA